MSRQGKSGPTKGAVIDTPLKQKKETQAPYVPPSRVGKRVVSGYLDADLRMRFRQVALALDMSVQDLLQEVVEAGIEQKIKEHKLNLPATH